MDLGFIGGFDFLGTEYPRTGFEIVWANEISPACATYRRNIQFHYELPRRISMREAARLQSFPDTFVFTGKLRETERQIGNAVPPVLAWHIANAVMDVLGACCD